MPIELLLSRFTFSLTARDPILLPSYKGSTLRGGFGHAFKKVVCTIRNVLCSECLLYEKCVYSYIFETPPPKATKIMRKYRAAPHPFVIEPPLENKTKYLPGEELRFGLILVGRAIDYLPYFIYTFEELGRLGIGRGRGEYDLREVTSVSPYGETEVVYSGEDKVLKSDLTKVAFGDFLQLPKVNTNTISLNFLTPTRIVYNGHLTINLDFHILLRNLLRRVALLSYFHCDGNPDTIDFTDLIEKAKDIDTLDRRLHWTDWERYSARQDTRMMMGGFTGKASFEGELDEFLPFISIGEYLHLGKGTTFGLGKYEILKTL